MSLLTIAITLTVLGFYVWAGVFYALSLLMLTKVGVDTTKEIRTEIKTNKKMKKKTSMTSAASNRDGTELTDVVEDKADFSWQRLE